jgi:dTDP-4-amino-4,6-dideoxygalactose transaminase
MSQRVNRREFVTAAAAAGLGIAATGSARAAGENGKPAILGGKSLRTRPFPAWPVTEKLDEDAVRDVVHSHRWCRIGQRNVDRFEQAYARLTGAKHCLATANGTSALIASLGALEIGPGHEVIVSPYTFIATINAILVHYAIPVFVDTDPETFQIDARKIEAAITDRTAAILPVHIGGSPADLDSILAVADKHRLPVIEDACQAVLGEWRNRKVGTFGKTGCFSFQESKNLCSGEGGAILSDDDKLAERLDAFHNNCRARTMGSYNFSYTGTRAANFRMTEFQGALLLAQMTRVEKFAHQRESNAHYLTSLLEQIPGIIPAKTYPGCTRNVYHLYMARYQPEHFANLPREKFFAALSAEGIPAFGGYSPMSSEKFLHEVLASPAFARIYPKRLLDEWPERNQCPENYKLCGETIWFGQSMFLGPREDMDQVAEAIRRIQAHAAEIAKT